MNIQNANKANTVFDKLCLGIAETIAIFMIMGLVLSCSIVDEDTSPDSFTISYPRIASEVSATSMPVIVSGKDCDLRGLTDAGSATYSIAANTGGTTAPTLPAIDERTGEVNNKNASASAGAYKVTVKVAGNAGCNTDVLVYNTITLTNREDLTNHLFGGNSGIAHHGNTGDFNYIDTSKVTNFSKLFEGKTLFNGDITEWSTSNVADMNRTFSNAAKFNQPIGGWDTSKVVDMGYMFANALAFNQPLLGWDTSEVVDMNHMFYKAHVFDQPIGSWDTSKVRNMSRMFQTATNFDQPIGEWETSNVTDMGRVFYNARVFNQPLSNWNTSKVVNMDLMFNSATNFNQPIGNWDTSKVTRVFAMFNNAKSFNQDLSGWDVSSVTLHSVVFQHSAMEGKTSWYPDPTWTP